MLGDFRQIECKNFCRKVSKKMRQKRSETAGW